MTAPDNRLPHAVRIERILAEIKGVRAQYGVTDWEYQRLEEWAHWWNLSPKQAAILDGIERRVFNDTTNDTKED